MIFFSIALSISSSGSEVIEIVADGELMGATETVGAADGATIADGALGSGETVGDWLHAGTVAISAHRQMSNLVFIGILWE